MRGSVPVTALERNQDAGPWYPRNALRIEILLVDLI
jgi:hypothetical protein